jgi:PAS domain S-box-containing protein
LLYISPAFERIWGVPAEVVYEKPLGWLDYVHEDDRDGVCSQVAGEPDMRDPYEMEYRIVRPDGEVRWIRNRVYPVFGTDGELDKVCGTVEDITRLNDLQRQKADMYSMLRHDIKSPLSVIRGNAEMLMKGVAADKRGQTESIISNVERISAQLDGLVDIARLDEGRLYLKEERLDPEALIIETVLDHRDRAEVGGIKLIRDIEPGLPNVAMDRLYALRALGNLMQNAINHSGAGSEITVGAKIFREDGRDFVGFTVSDKGAGIDPADKDKIFLKYYRSGNSSGIPGSGLGLAVVKAVADAHGGSIRLISSPGKGSEFSLIIPVE